MSDEKKYHPSVQHVVQFFSYEHLPEPLKQVSAPCAFLAKKMAGSLPSNPETTAGLRHLLEAKDCFVRSKMLEAGEGQYRPPMAVQTEMVDPVQAAYLAIAQAAHETVRAYKGALGVVMPSWDECDQEMKDSCVARVQNCIIAPAMMGSDEISDWLFVMTVYNMAEPLKVPPPPPPPPPPPWLK